GQPVKGPDPEVKKKIVGSLPGITCRPADLIGPQLAQFERQCARWKQQDEDVLTYAMFPSVAKEYFQYRQAQQTGIDPSVADVVNGAYPV
ncbi:MAG: oxaloacetate decarboxylase subunit alpha, partial [Clostridium sp.]|nr:oxaloacetate decarboxylase subunit alpha [Clostridium sp.]